VENDRRADTGLTFLTGFLYIRDPTHTIEVNIITQSRGQYIILTWRGKYSGQDSYDTPAKSKSSYLPLH